MRQKSKEVTRMLHIERAFSTPKVRNSFGLLPQCYCERKTLILKRRHLDFYLLLLINLCVVHTQFNYLIGINGNGYPKLIRKYSKISQKLRTRMSTMNYKNAGNSLNCFGQITNLNFTRCNLLEHSKKCYLRH